VDDQRPVVGEPAAEQGDQVERAGGRVGRLAEREPVAVGADQVGRRGLLLAG
jgi:hypothetical protein